MINLKQKYSRGPELDITKCADNVGGNRFNLVIMAAARAKQILRDKSRRGQQYLPSAPVTALIEIQDGKFK